MSKFKSHNGPQAGSKMEPQMEPRKEPRTGRRERGLTLLEVGMALALAAAVIAGMSWYATSAAQKMKRRGDAQYLVMVARAGEAYVTKNQGDLLQGGALDPTLKPLGTVIAVTVQNLKDDGELSSSVQNVFGNQQHTTLLLKAVTNPGYVAGPPAKGTPYLVKGLVTTYGGANFTNDQAGQIVNLAGAAGGFISSTVDTTHIDGSAGAWRESPGAWATLAAYKPQVGHVMALVGMSYGAGGTSNDGPWLARKVIDGGAPPYEHNTMQTDINMTEIGAAHSFSLLGALNVEAAQYQGAVPGGDILIGTNPIASSIGMQFQNTFSVGSVAGGIGTGEGFTLTNLGKGANGSHWNAEEPQIIARQDDDAGAWDTVFDSQPNGTLNLSTPSTSLTHGGTVPGLMNLNARGDSSQINLNATDPGSMININASAPDASGHVVVSSPRFSVRDPAGSGGGLEISISDLRTVSSLRTGNFYLQQWGGSSFHSPCPANWCSALSTIPALNSGSTSAIGLGYDVQGHWINNEDIWVSSDLYANDTHGQHVATASDRRLKYDISPINDALIKIDQLQGHYFKWKANGAADMGVIAQEVERVYPQLVDTMHGGPRKGMKEVSYNGLIGPLIEAVKTLHHMLNDALATFTRQIAALQQDDQTLQAQVQTLSAQNAALKADLAQQRLDLIELKCAVHQPLSAAEHALCGAACAP